MKKLMDANGADLSPDLQDGTLGTASAAHEQKAKARRGAAFGNQNRLTHGLNRGRPIRDSEQRQAERHVNEILRHYHLDGDPLARLVGKQLRRLESAAERLERRLERRGVFTKAGQPQQTLTVMVQIIERLLAESRRLLDQLTEANKARSPFDGDVTFVCHFHDGSPVFTDRPHMPGDPIPREATWARQEPAGDVLSDEEPEGTPASETPVQRSLRRKLARHETKHSPEMPAAPAAGDASLGPCGWRGWV